MFTSDSVSPECQSLYAEGVCNSSPVIGFNTLYRDACTACPTASPAPSSPPPSPPPPTSSLLERICDCAIQSGLCDQTCNAMFTSDSVSPECQSLYAEGVCNSSPVIGFNTLYRDACTACPTASPAPSGPPGSCYVFLQGCNQIESQQALHKQQNYA